MKQDCRKNIGILDELFRNGSNANLMGPILDITLPKVQLSLFSNVIWLNLANSIGQQDSILYCDTEATCFIYS